MDTWPNFPEMWRGLVSRVAEMERQTLGVAKAQAAKANAELDTNRAAAWQSVALLNGYTDVGIAPFGYYRDSFGRVYFRGRIQAPSPPPAAGALMFVVAANYKPAYHELLGFGSDAVWVESGGNVYPLLAPAASARFSFGSLSYRTT